MKVMDDVIFENNLTGAFLRELNAAPGDPQNWDVDEVHSELDETSDVEDPEKTAKDNLKEYKQEVKENDNFFQMAVVETAQRASECSQIHLDMERARMELEDLRGQILRPYLGSVSGAYDRDALLSTECE